MDKKRDILAHRQGLLHEFVLRETSKINSVSRNDHKVMLKILVHEAYKMDPERAKNRERWRKNLKDLEREVNSKNSIMSISADPYQACLAKLSSMMLWNNGVRYWTYRYWDEELARRRSVQASTLAAIRGKKSLFLNPAN